MENMEYTENVGNAENESLPYPEMDIDFVRRETQSKGVSHYYSTIVTKIHYAVKYRCCFCGVENEDEDQFFEWSKRTHARDDRTRLENEEQIIRDIKTLGGRNTAAETEKNIAAREYALLGLKCSCRWCGKKQPWSDFWPEGGVFAWIKSMFLSGNDLVYLVVLALVIALLFLPPLADIGLIFLLFAPSIAALVHNRLMQKKSMELNELYRPEISIVYKSESPDEEE